MEDINTIYSNIVSDLSHEEMIHYIDNVMEADELRSMLLSLDEIRKEEIIENEMNTAMNKISGQIENMLNAVDSDLKKAEHKKYLRGLELQLKLLRLTESIAKHANDKELLLKTNNQISEVFTIYRMDGGTNMFYTKDSNHE